ncbi:probable ATP-dependent RNA helicase DDX52 [Hyposmocoma kahamanoa]|uniref:probable ATP-dependent RNA helicase DDX52 n=1 Tax=Hyposmocoma kahamanoa TaxID=1477025 RepID=UPI000E6D9A51|nr:probable ATP-dependent RNA helicase DDX52 [Hyposmocoma kahamanoa]
MDAYDIFKKLTKGLTFKRKVLGVKNNDPSPTLQQIKKEEIKTEKSEEDIKYESLSDPENTDHDDNSNDDEELQLVEGVKVGEKRKKRRKEKPIDLKKKLELEEQNHFRNLHGIKAIGRHIPAALQDFSDLTSRYNVSAALVDTVGRCGYSEPTPIQRQALPCMLEDRQILACAPTGSGKTAAFLLPLIHTLGAAQGGPRALILCPTRELAHQIYREALRLSTSSELRCSVLRNMKESKVKEREATIRKSDIIISTPNRLCYLLNRDNVGITLEKVRWLIIDEADKLFEGSAEQESDFRQQLEQIMGACGSQQRRVAMFSATHTPNVAKWCRHNMRGLINITIGQSQSITAFQFGRRDNVVRSFRVGRIWVLICTELMGRGIDFRGVNLVINYDFPPSAISYIHRVGRAGRAGQRGRAITFFTQDDAVNLRSIAAVMKQSGCEVPDYMLKLKLNRNKQKKRASKAPSRDNISTILEKPQKRKLNEKDSNQNEKAKDTDTVKNGMKKKHRKIQNGTTTKTKNQNGVQIGQNAKKSLKKTKSKVLAKKVIKRWSTGKKWI